MALRRQFRRFLKTGFFVLALAGALAIAAVSWADVVVPDGDVVSAGDQSSVDLGTVSPGQLLTKSVSFRLVCDSKNHLDSGQSLALDFALAQSTVPSGGSLGATNASVGPIPASWPDDTTGSGSTNCPSPAPAPIADNGDSTVTITAPSTPGSKTFVVRWNFGTPTPAGSGDSNAVQGSNTTVTFTLTVAAADTTAPTSSASATANGNPYAFGNWTRFDVGVTLTGSDTGGSGLKEIRYTLDGTTPSASAGAIYSSPFSISSQGTTTLKWVAVDNSGNVESPVHSQPVKIDKTAPTVSCGSADGAWHGSDVSIDCTSSDGLSGLASSGDASFDLSTSVGTGNETANAQTGSRSVSDVAGNVVTAGPIGGNKVDKKHPTIACTPPDDSVWYGDNVTVNCTASDGGAGLANAGDASFLLSTSVSAGDETASAATGSKSVADDVGNSDSTGPFTFKVDLKAPQLSGCDSPDGNWYGNDVTLFCTYTDGGSGPVSQQVSLSTNVSAGDETDSAVASAGGERACDAVDNCAASPADIAGNKVDKKHPTIACTPPDDSVWYGDNVTVNCTASDGGAGLANAGDASFLLSTSVSAGDETASAATGSKSVADDVGNSDSTGPFTFKVDLKAPQLSGCDSPDGNWYGNDVTLFCTYTDGGSGPVSQQVSLSTNVSAGDETDSAVASAGGERACDAVDNCAASPADIAGNKVDKKAPSVSCGAADGNWHANDVSIACTASDGGSGVAPSADESFSLATHVVAGSETANASTDSKEVKDAVGNSATAGPISGNKVDKKAPSVSCGAADGNWHANDVSIACTASDGGSGVAPSADESFSLATHVVAGSETANASTDSKEVKDAVGNSATAGPISGNKVDKKAPSVSCGAADGNWHANDVSIACTASDGGSGVAPSADESFSLATHVVAGSETANASTDSKEVKDAVGNSATAGPISGNKVDKKAPSVSCGAADGNWHANDVSIACTASDGGSGVAPRPTRVSRSRPTS